MTLPAEKLITINDRGARVATTFGSVTSGGANMVFIKKLTASSSSTLSFVDGASSVVLDNTYKEYIFTFKNIHPQTDDAHFMFQGNASGGSGYNETITSTSFRAYHNEGDSDSSLSYGTNSDQANGTAFQRLIPNMDNDNDSNGGGYLHLFNPSSTTFVKHFISTTQGVYNSAYSWNMFVAGYFNTTSAIDEIQFKMSSGNIDAGDICLYGIL
jgi:hypothetical protein